LFKQIRKAKKPLYFVFDGFENLEKNEIENLIPIFDNLPWGKAKFIFTGLKEQLCHLFGLRNIKTKDFVVSNFGITETRQYFKDLTIDENRIQEIHRLSDKGHPEKLKELKLLCNENGGVEQFLNSDLITEKNDFLEMLWSKVDKEDEIQNNILSLIAFNDIQIDLQTVSHILKIDIDQLRNKVSSLNFVEITNENIRFHSETFTKFVQNKLKDLEDKANSILIEYYEENKIDDNSIFNLPNLYKKAKQWEKLTKFYSIDAFIHIIKKYQSLGNVNQHFSQGFDASKMNKNKFDEAYLRFALHKSSVIELEKYVIPESEIEARIALGDYEQALILANSAFLKEDRLKLLTILAKEIKLNDLNEFREKEKDLIEQITNLYGQIDFSSIREKGFEIAGLLIYSCYDLAIDLVEKITDNNANESSLDYAFAYLSLYANEANKKNKNQVIDTDYINEKIQNSDVKNITKALSFLSDEYNVDQIIENVEKLNNFNQKIFLLKNWIQNNKNLDGVERAIKYALEEIIKASTENVPNATTLSEIASPLPNIKDYKELGNIILLFDAHKDTIDRPTKNYVKLQLTIADALYGFNKDKANDRIFDIYCLIDDLNDLSIKTDCLCLLWLWLIKNDHENKIEKLISSSVTIECQIQNNIELLLGSTAYHFKMIEFIVKTLVAEKTDFVLDVIKKINTQQRRDVASKLAVSNYLQKKNIADIDLKDINKFEVIIVDIRKKEEVIIEVIDKFFNEKKKVLGHIEKLEPYFNVVFKITKIENKCYALAHAIKILNYENDKYKDTIKHLLTELNDSWENIDSQWNKIEIGFHIARDLVDYSKDEASKYLKLATDLKNKESFSSNSIVSTYINSVKLCIRSFSGLTLFKSDLVEELSKLAEIINNIHSVGERLELWSELLHRIYVNKKRDLFDKIYKEFLNPLLLDRNNLENSCQMQTIINIAPILYLYNQNVFSIDYLNKLPNNFQDLAIANICDFILTKIYLDDPSDENSNLPELEYSELNDVCVLMEKLSDDFLIYHFVGNIVKALKVNHHKLSIEQRETIKVKIKNIIDKQLPTVDGIKHEGYKIISEASLLSIEEFKHQPWDLLVKRTEKIPNVSDRALTFVILAEKINAKSNKEKINLMEKSFNLIQSIPSVYDKTNRLDSTWETWLDIDRGKFNKYIRIAYQDLLKSKDDEINGLRNLIDVAQQHDSTLANNLITMLDQDSARKKLKEPLIKRIESNNKITAGSTDFNTLHDLNPYQFGKVFKKNLKDLNSGKMVTREVKSTFDLIEKASTLSLKEAFEAYQYFIQNAIKRFESNQKESDILNSIFIATVENTKLIALLSMDNINKMNNLYSMNKKTKTKSNIVIIPSGEKEKAICYIRDWIDKNIIEKMFVIDPYFTENELELLKIVQEIKPSCHVTVLTSKKSNKNCHHEPDDVNNSRNKDVYKHSWRKLSSEPPIDTTIKIVWDKITKECPFHDRWYVADDSSAGISIGTSFNGLGNRDSQISELDEEALDDVKEIINLYIYKSERKVKKYNLKYEQFDLDY
jgi:hypothetical protein